MLSANLSHHLPKIIFVSDQYLFLIFEVMARRLSHIPIRGSFIRLTTSTARNSSSTVFIDETILILKSWFWNMLPVFAKTCSSLFTITRSSSQSSLHNSRHSICHGCMGLKYHDVITIVFGIFVFKKINLILYYFYNVIIAILQFISFYPKALYSKIICTFYIAIWISD